MHMRNLIKSKYLNEDGFASIVIALTLIIVLALLTLGFAQLSRREQQTALNKHLANQAFYAAESGVNDVIQDVNNDYICDPSIVSCPPGAYTPTADQCIDTSLLPPTALTKQHSIVSSQAAAAYTCVMVNLTPKSEQLDKTPPDTGQHLYFTTNPAPNTLTLQWGSGDNNNTKFKTDDPTNSSTEFPPKSQWGNFPPVVMVSLTKVPNASNVTRAQLLSNTFYMYLYPSTKTVGTIDSTGPQGQIIPGGCQATGNNYPCSVTVDNLGSNANYILHFTAYYDSVDMYVTGQDSGGNAVKFIGQDVIDVTGKAQNVLKRVQVRLNADSKNGHINPDAVLQDNALQAQNICKRLETRPTNTDFITPNGATLIPPTTDPCYLNN